jgi:glycosyltransferase involved in cell wall biosynthesis
MKSVAYVTTAFPTLAFFVEADVHRLVARGVRVKVFTLRSPRHRKYQPEHEPLLPITEWLGSPFDPRSWAALLAWTLRRPHVLLPEIARILWASRGSLYALYGHVGYLPATARIASRVERGGFDRVHAAWSHFPGTVAYLVWRLTGVPFSLSAHAGSDLYRTQAFLAEKVRAADFTATCVAWNAGMLRRLAGEDARVACVYHGIDLARFDGRGRSRQGEPLLLGVGRLQAVKGFDLAVEAVARLAARGVAARLTLVGDGPDRRRLEALARERGVADRVTFLDGMRQSALLDLYRRAWMLLMPCRVLPNGRRDGIPNVVVEAMAMGLPVVGTRVAGLEETVTDGVDGALVPPDDAGALAAEVERLIGDPAGLDRLGVAARARVAERFDAERNFERLLALMNGGRAAALERPAAAMREAEGA